MKAYSIAAAIAVSASLSACGNPNSHDVADAAADAAEQAIVETNAVIASAEDSPVSTISAADRGRICRAAIASIFGRDPSIIRVLGQADGIVRVRYSRPDDGTVWTNECRVNASTVDWRAVDNGRPGRWRTEDTLRFKQDGASITVEQFMNGEHINTKTHAVS